MKRFFTMVLLGALTSVCGPVLAEDELFDDSDVCINRPDLCEEKPKVKKATTGWKTVTPPKVANPPTRRCRVRGQTYALEDMKLPYCQTKAKGGWRMPASTPSETASATEPVPPPTDPPAIDFERYMRNNSNHAALNNKIENRQQAFQEVQKPAVISLPGSTSEPATSTPKPSATDSSGATPTTPAASPPAQDSGFQY